MQVIVVGAGMAGLAAALCLGRGNHSVLLLDRDPLHVSADPSEAFHWSRRGIAHFQQPHAFLPRGRRELKLLFPDVYSTLLDAGATDYSVSEKIQHGSHPDDHELVYLSVRRPIIEWALRRAILREPSVVVRTAIVRDLLIESGKVPAVRGVVLGSGEQLKADLVVDAQGRRTSFPSKLASARIDIPIESSSTHILYYSRYFKMLPGKQFPRGPWLTTPRGDLGYAGYSSFTGENGTFALVLAIGTWDRELRCLQHEAAWTAATSRIERFAPLIHHEFAAPITPVLAMGETQNTLLRYIDDGRDLVRRFIPVGDSVCHTDPTFALGLSFALIHARALKSALESPANDPGSVLRAYWAAIYPEMRERFDFAVAADNDRARIWRGEPLDPFHANGSYPMFTMVAATIAALQDDDIFRKTVRRMGFLDPLSVFDDDRDLHRKIEEITERSLRSMPPPKSIGREDLLAAVRTATHGNINSMKQAAPS